MTFVNSVFNHLWQSTLFAAVVALLILALRKNQARWRCRLWLAASIKFLIPFSVLAGIGSRLGWRSLRAAPAGLSIFLDQVGQSLAPPVVHQVVVRSSIWVSLLPLFLAVLWFVGFVAAIFRWCLSRHRLKALVGAAIPFEDGREVRALRRIERTAGMRGLPILSSAGHLEPGIFGIFHTVLLWPDGISERLTDAQLEAIMAHEVCHARRRDNLAAALHMLVEAAFWFHPLVWWLGARLVDEREKACDEEVLLSGGDPEAYAESILKTCQFFLEAPRMCMAGVTGSDLKQRIERIMLRRIGHQLDVRRKLLLAVAGLVAVAGPIAFGVANAPIVRAQSQPAAALPAFEVASVKPNSSDDHRAMFRILPGGRLDCTNISPKMLITMAYSLEPNQLSGGPNWLDSAKYDISAKAEGPDDPERLKLMMQTLLASRFKLAVHRETKEMPIYELVAGKNGPKLKPSPETGDDHKGRFTLGHGQMNLEGVTLPELANNLSHVVGRNVYDRTGIAGTYEVKLEWTPEEGEFPGFKDHGDGKQAANAPEATGPSLFDALQAQLGLKLEASKGPVEIVVIDHIEKASEN